MLLYVTLRHASEGLGKTLPPMLIAGTALPLNALLNYAFIYGEFGAPELGRRRLRLGDRHRDVVRTWIDEPAVARTATFRRPA